MGVSGWAMIPTRKRAARDLFAQAKREAPARRAFRNHRRVFGKIIVFSARRFMCDQGFGQDWIETYTLALRREIDAVTTQDELNEIRDRVLLLRKRMPPIGWLGA